jgi:hypothetical protein
MAMVQRLRARFRVPADLPVRLREAPTDAREASGAALVDGVDAYSQNRFSARLRHCVRRRLGDGNFYKCAYS